MDRNLQKYMAFVKTASYGSFTQAARKLNYSQSGVSRMIGDLESEWNVTLLERGDNAEVAEVFRRQGLAPKVHVTLWDDYAILSMVESGLGVSILPRLILKRSPYQVAVRPLEPAAYRDIVLALRSRATASLAVRRFLEYWTPGDSQTGKPGE